MFSLPPWTNQSRALMSDSLTEDVSEILHGTSAQMVLQYKGELCDATRIVLPSSIFLRPAVILFPPSLSVIASASQCRQRSVPTTKYHKGEKKCGFWMNCHLKRKFSNTKKRELKKSIIWQYMGNKTWHEDVYSHFHSKKFCFCEPSQVEHSTNQRMVVQFPVPTDPLLWHCAAVQTTI